MECHFNRVWFNLWGGRHQAELSLVQKWQKPLRWMGHQPSVRASWLIWQWHWVSWQPHHSLRSRIKRNAFDLFILWPFYYAHHTCGDMYPDRLWIGWSRVTSVTARILWTSLWDDEWRHRLTTRAFVNHNCSTSLAVIGYYLKKPIWIRFTHESFEM